MDANITKVAKAVCRNAPGADAPAKAAAKANCELKVREAAVVANCVTGRSDIYAIRCARKLGAALWAAPTPKAATTPEEAVKKLGSAKSHDAPLPPAETALIAAPYIESLVVLSTDSDAAKSDPAKAFLSTIKDNADKYPAIKAALEAAKGGGTPPPSEPSKLHYGASFVFPLSDRKFGSRFGNIDNNAGLRGTLGGDSFLGVGLAAQFHVEVLGTPDSYLGLGGDFEVRSQMVRTIDTQVSDLNQGTLVDYYFGGKFVWSKRIGDFSGSLEGGIGWLFRDSNGKSFDTGFPTNEFTAPKSGPAARAAACLKYGYAKVCGQVTETILKDRFSPNKQGSEGINEPPVFGLTLGVESK